MKLPGDVVRSGLIFVEDVYAIERRITSRAEIIPEDRYGLCAQIGELVCRANSNKEIILTSS